MKYEEFLATKEKTSDLHGFEPLWFPKEMKDFQHFFTTWSIRQGRSSLFQSVGLGKSIQTLTVLENVVRKTNKPVLLATPLAVGEQMCREGEKFGIDCRRTRDGSIKKGINVTNYEQLHRFSPSILSGFGGDECFVAGTPVDTINPIDGSLESRYIEDIRPGDFILNASGVDRVKATKSRHLEVAVHVKIGERNITCSENHPFFTVHGWRSAKDLRAGDYLVETKEAMRLVRGDISTQICGCTDTTLLRNILLSEMADEYSRECGQSTYTGSSQEEGQKQIRLVEKRWPRSTKYDRQIATAQTYSRTNQENDRNKNQEWNLSAVEGGKRRKWKRPNHSRANFDGFFGEKLETLNSAVGFFVGISDTLQNRLWQRKKKNSNRSGWSFPPNKREKRTGHKENQKTGIVRVDSVEIYESGHPELEKMGLSRGSLRFYDLEAEQHPSFSIHGCLVHNSGICKHHDSKTRRTVTDFTRNIPYRLLATATPSPNDYIELGNSAEILGYMKYSQMLGMFFTNSGDDTQSWELKPHAKKRFWKWVSSWARALSKPSDFGFDDTGYILPPLVTNQYVVEEKKKYNGFHRSKTLTLDQQRAERRATLQQRCEKVAELITKRNDYSIAWCHLNPEGDLLEKLIPGAVQVSGSQSDEEKEEKLSAFAQGQIKVLVSKPRLGGWGLNLQVCNHMTFFPSYSYESMVQCMGRCQRFGQKRQVYVDIVTSAGEAHVVKNMSRKKLQMEEMYRAMVANMHEVITEKQEESTQEMRLPRWLLN